MKNLTICDNMVGSRGYYILSEVRQRKTNTIWFPVYVEYKKIKQSNKTKQNRFIETETKRMVIRNMGWQIGGKGEREYIQ